MRECIYHNAEWKLNNNLNKTPGRIGRDVHCRADYEGCDVMPATAGTLKTLPVDTPRGQGIPAPRVDVNLGAPFCCAEGWSNTCERSGGPAMNCRDSDAYYKCLGSQATPSNSELARSCEQQYCWYKGGGKGEGDGTGGKEEGCRRECKEKMRVCQVRAPVAYSPLAYSPLWCDETLDECFAKCSGGGGKGKKECGLPPVFFKSVKNLRCVDGQWAWDNDGVGGEEDPGKFCAQFPKHEKCRKSEPGICEEKLATYEATIRALDEQIAGLKLSLADAKDALTKKKDEIRALKKNQASHAKISAALQEFKTLKRAASAIISKGQKLTWDLRSAKENYSRLQYQCYPPVY